MPNQKGFTLIEIAIVLVIIGLLLGGVLKGQELITSARVRNVITQQDGIKAAFFGFQDRYRALPGDYPAAQATANIQNVGAAIGGDGDGVIELANGAGAAETTIAWVHLSHAGFLTGNFNMAANNEAPAAVNTPTNPYNAFLRIIHDNVYDIVAGDPAATQRLNVKSGNQIPVEIIAEIDRKIDDGNAGRGIFRFSAFPGAGVAPVAADCFAAATGAWLTTSGQTNCGAANLY